MLSRISNKEFKNSIMEKFHNKIIQPIKLYNYKFIACTDVNNYSISKFAEDASNLFM